jgi:hypothetical protein
MTTLSPERISPSARRGNDNASSARLLGQDLAQRNVLRASFAAAAAFDRAKTPRTRRAVLDRFLTEIGG